MNILTQYSSIHRSRFIFNNLLVITTFTIITLLNFNKVQAQNIGINTANPDASSILDITHTNRGLLIPRIVLTATNIAAPIITPALSLLVYNTNTTLGVNGVKPGYYYWDGLQWTSLSTPPPTTNTLANTTNTLTSTVNGVIATSLAVNTVTNTSTTNNITTTVNGVTATPVPIINSLSNNYTTTTGLFNTTINGVISANITLPTAQNIKDSVTANAWLLKGNNNTNGITNFIGTTNAQDLVFKTNGIENMRILNTSGNVGIGTTAPAWKIDVQGGRSMFSSNSTIYALGVRFDPTTYPFFIGASNVLNTSANTIAGMRSDLIFTEAGGTEWMRIVGANGKVGINTSSPTEKLEVTGSVKIVDGTQGSGKMLTSDAAGKGSWVKPTYKYPNTFANGSSSTIVNVPSPSGSWVIISAPLVITIGGVYKIKGNIPIDMTPGPGNFYYLALQDASNSRSYELIDLRPINTVINSVEYLAAGTYYMKILTSGSSTVNIGGINLLAEALFLE
ncbi:MAG: hypothetical protein H7331_03045 [Bacteroidia bacterium]|nr:hypothetical protein [Bacteroidia bacterium]